MFSASISSAHLTTINKQDAHGPHRSPEQQIAWLNQLNGVIIKKYVDSVVYYM